jgi:hypothetical protein
LTPAIAIQFLHLFRFSVLLFTGIILARYLKLAAILIVYENITLYISLTGFAITNGLITWLLPNSSCSRKVQYYFDMYSLISGICCFILIFVSIENIETVSYTHLTLPTKA